MSRVGASGDNPGWSVIGQLSGLSNDALIHHQKDEKPR